MDVKDVEVDVEKAQGIYAPHFDPDVVIPDRVARPCLASSQVFLLLSALCATRGYYGLGVVSFTLYVTSVNHWRKPRMTSWRHYVDLLAVAGTAVYGSWCAATRAKDTTWMVVWFAGLGTILACFIANETCYFYQVLGGEKRSRCVAWTAPGTEERHRAYARAMWTHLACVHVASGALAMVVVAWGLEPPGI